MGVASLNSRYRIWGAIEDGQAMGFETMDTAISMPDAASREPATGVQLLRMIDLRTFPRLPDGDVSVRIAAALTVFLFCTANAQSDPISNESGTDGYAPRSWIPFNPPRDDFDPTGPIDLRFLNEKVAGEKGQIVTRDGHFVHSATGEVVRFWAVNGPPRQLRGESLVRCARMLAKQGVNLVRVHGGLVDEKTGQPNRKRMEHMREIVQVMRDEGIYTHLSIYFPIWFSPNKA